MSRDWMKKRIKTNLLQDINIKEKLLRKKHLLHFEVEIKWFGLSSSLSFDAHKHTKKRFSCFCEKKRIKEMTIKTIIIII